MKSSERRAIALALTNFRCPSCNRMGSVHAQSPSLYYCDSCGWGGQLAVSFTSRPTGSGARTVAEIGGSK
jgi:ribosomal protein L37AE/L43A